MIGIDNIVRMRKAGQKPSAVFVEMLPSLIDLFDQIFWIMVRHHSQCLRPNSTICRSAQDTLQRFRRSASA